ncbi:MAG: hypothetical protein IJC11_00755 [Alphaproteobacteria bacterium]|nr:hypothetical protein [Alphaproteobacteria bacterium]
MLKIIEEDLIKELANGSSNLEIAEKYGMTLQGVKQRLYMLYKKNGVKNRIQFLNKVNLRKKEIRVYMSQLWFDDLVKFISISRRCGRVYTGLKRFEEAYNKGCSLPKFVRFVEIDGNGVREVA